MCYMIRHNDPTNVFKGPRGGTEFECAVTNFRRGKVHWDTNLDFYVAENWEMFWWRHLPLTTYLLMIFLVRTPVGNEFIPKILHAVIWAPLSWWYLYVLQPTSTREKVHWDTNLDFYVEQMYSLSLTTYLIGITTVGIVWTCRKWIRTILSTYGICRPNMMCERFIRTCNFSVQGRCCIGANFLQRQLLKPIDFRRSRSFKASKA